MDRRKLNSTLWGVQHRQHVIGRSQHQELRLGGTIRLKRQVAVVHVRVGDQQAELPLQLDAAGIFGGQIASAQGGAIPESSALEAEPEATEAGEEQMPWHDPALSMDDRLKLVKGKSQERVRRVWAAWKRQARVRRREVYPRRNRSRPRR